MLKQTIKFKDYNDVDREMDYFFDLNETELIELQIDTVGGLHEKINKVLKMNDQKEIYNLFKTILKASYGEKSDDGIHFDKSEDVWKRFISSPAYNELMKSFMEKPEKIADFIEGLMPNMSDAQLAEFQKKKKEIVDKYTGDNDVQR